MRYVARQGDLSPRVVSCDDLNLQRLAPDGRIAKKFEILGYLTLVAIEMTMHAGLCGLNHPSTEIRVDIQ